MLRHALAAIVLSIAALLPAACGQSGGGSAASLSALPIAPPLSPMRAWRFDPKELVTDCVDPTNLWCLKFDVMGNNSVTSSESQDWVYDYCKNAGNPGCDGNLQSRAAHISKSNEVMVPGAQAKFLGAGTASMGLLAYSLQNTAATTTNQAIAGSSDIVDSASLDLITIKSHTTKPGTFVDVRVTIAVHPASSQVDCTAHSSAVVEALFFFPSIPGNPFLLNVTGQCAGGKFSYVNSAGMAGATTAVAELPLRVGKTYQIGFTMGVHDGVSCDCTSPSGGKNAADVSGQGSMYLEVLTPGGYFTSASGYDWK